MRSRLPQVLSLIFATVLLPLGVALLGVWEQQRGAADWAALDAERHRLAAVVDRLQARAPADGSPDYGMEFSRNGQLFGGPLALSEARDARDEAATLTTVMALRRWLPPVVIGAAGCAAILSALTLLAGAVLGAVGGRSREALVRGFAILRHALPALLATQVGLGTAAFVSAVMFEAAALARPGLGTGDIKMLGLAALAVAGSLVVAAGTLASLRRAVTAFEPEPLHILARPVSPDEAPGLWRLVGWLADRLGALPPDAIVVGLTDGFFVSAGSKVLQPSGTALAGRTLHVPLVFLPVLRVDELAAIIGHELAHFAGGDTDYSQRFLPIYAGIGRSLDGVVAAGAGRGSAFGLLSPAMRLGLFVMERFHRAVRRWSRAREFAADAAGAGPVGSEAAIRALLRVAAVQPRIDAVLRAAADDPEGAPSDLVAATFDDVCAQGLEDPAAGLDAAQPHPNDTHPPTRERIKALGGRLTSDLLDAARASPAPEALGGLSAYLADPAGLCAAASADVLTVVRRRRTDAAARLAAIAAAVDGADQVLRHDMRAGALAGLVGAGVFAAVGVALSVFGLQGLAAGEARFAALVALGAGAVLGSVGALRWRLGQPVFLVLRPEALEVPGLNAPIAWADLADVDVRARNNRVTLRLLLAPGAPAPRRVAGARRVKLDADRGIVTVAAVLPRKMTPRDLGGLIGRYRQAAAARQILTDGSTTPRQAAVVPKDRRSALAAHLGPPRPSRLPVRRQTGWVLAGILMFGAMLGWEVVTLAPLLVTDWLIRDAARPAAAGAGVEGRCSSQFVFLVCQGTLTVSTPSGTLSRRVSTMVTGVSAGELPVHLMADPARPEWITTDLALDGLPNRTVTFAAVAGVLLAGTVLPSLALVRNRRTRRPGA